MDAPMTKKDTSFEYRRAHESKGEPCEGGFPFSLPKGETPPASKVGTCTTCLAKMEMDLVSEHGNTVTMSTKSFAMPDDLDDPS
jgi:hypothetical protein